MMDFIIYQLLSAMLDIVIQELFTPCSLGLGNPLLIIFPIKIHDSHCLLSAR